MPVRTAGNLGAAAGGGTPGAAEPLRLHWFLPGHGDGRDIARNQDRSDLRREPDINYLAQVAKATDALGFCGVLTPFGMFCEDPWLVAAALAAATDRLRFMVALRPGLMSPMLAAQMAATCQRMSGNRLMLNIVAGGDRDELARYGDRLDHDRRYARAGEFLAIFRGALSGTPYDFCGDHYEVKGATVPRPPDQLPEIFLGGSSQAAKETAARYADTYLAWGERPEDMAAHLTGLKKETAVTGRTVTAGTRFQVISRDTSAEAWAVAERLLEGMDPARITQAQQRFARSESEGQRRMAALHGGDPTRLEVYPNIWTGYGLVRPGPTVTLVGSHEEVCDRLAEFHALGLRDVILSGQPHIEEAYWFGEGVIPRLRRRGLLDTTA
ncbi:MULTISPECIES: LLM class flavin-dependent oxidoreductase [unclassified Streptomyces]|uniref:LLM class flavin-dependent oxidoreductase n=1 Tax=unclassified Streptomyces TaxID=2593676 RepID=UPI0009974DB5|nr:MULTISPECIES: LLM class flavin-dependent oxidoreductase [unclassified Streptomyces]MYT29241.1 LLM class flavin-dependent oxidoreductase [Streptomyces sp. SID8354]